MNEGLNLQNGALTVCTDFLCAVNTNIYHYYQYLSSLVAYLII
jgi:hypothetical protein